MRRGLWRDRAFSLLKGSITAKLINEAVDAGGDLENAVSTGFLEHLHQIEATKYLLPYLTERAKQELRG